MGSKKASPPPPASATAASASASTSAAGASAGNAPAAVGPVPKPPELAPFLTKVYDMVSDPATDAVISWTKAGSSFVVWDAHAFERDHLGRHFKHGNFSSFIRQLNTYVRFPHLSSPLDLLVCFSGAPIPGDFGWNCFYCGVGLHYYKFVMYYRC
jgi:hypothetical protein